MAYKGRKGKAQSLELLLRHSMPEYGVWEKLEKAALEWESIAGPILGRQSAPIDIVKGELIVAAETPLAGNRVTMMKGGIIRILAERWGLEITKVKVVIGRLPLKNVSRGGGAYTSRPRGVRVREEDVVEFESRCLERAPDFPEDAAASLARLRAFFLKRFGG